MSFDRRAATTRRSGRSLSLPARLAVSWLTNALVLALVAAILSNVSVHDTGSLLLAAAVFGVLNTVLKPLLRLLTLPLALLTLGLAWLFVSLLMLLLTEAIVSGFQIHGFWTLVAATIAVWAVNVLLDMTPGPWQLTGRRRRRRAGARLRLVETGRLTTDPRRSALHGCATVLCCHTSADPVTAGETA